MPNNQSTKKKLITTNSTLCLSLYLSYLYKLVTNIEWQSQSQKAKPKKKKTHRQQPHRQAQFITIHNTSTENSNMKIETPQVKSTSPHNTSTVSTFYESQILRSQHKVTNILLGFEGKDKSKYLWTVKAEAKKLGRADRATGSGGGKWVSRGSHTLTDVSN